MRSESSLDRSLWIVVLAIVLALVIANFAERPLFGGDGEASGFEHPLTVWVAGGESDIQTEAVARQVASCLQSGERPTGVGVLPGSSTAAVVDFLRLANPTPNRLLLITSTTLADIEHVLADSTYGETREQAELARQLLLGASPVGVLGTDPLALTVRSSSALRSTDSLLASLREDPAQPLVGVGEDSWLRGYLAALAQLARVSGPMPFEAFRSTREAVVSLQSGQAGVVLAPRSAIVAQLASGRLRALRWPAPGPTPRATLILLAPRGLTEVQLRSLRAQLRVLCPGAWRRLLHGDGLLPPTAGPSTASAFLRASIAEAGGLQRLAAHTVRDY